MKFSAAFLLAMGASTSAFTSPSMAKTKTLRMADLPADESNNNNDDQPQVPTDMPPLEQPVFTKSAPQMSESLPFMERPAALDGSLVGDVGFDPLGLAGDKETLLNYREAEVKHARLAMLAAAGWPISELFDRKIAVATGLKPLVDSADRAPSLLNGGLAKVSPVYWAIVLVAAGAIDMYGISRSKRGDPSYVAGDLGFDPLGLYPQDEAGRRNMQLKELKNGRLAMIAITAFAFQEFVSKLGVVDETPIFFKPLGQAMHEAANSGYYIPN